MVAGVESEQAELSVVEAEPGLDINLGIEKGRLLARIGVAGELEGDTSWSEDLSVMASVHWDVENDPYEPYFGIGLIFNGDANPDIERSEWYIDEDRGHFALRRYDRDDI